MRFYIPNYSFYQTDREDGHKVRTAAGFCILIGNTEMFLAAVYNLLELFVSSNFEISAPQCTAHYTPDGRGDILDIVVHQSVQLSEVIVTEILDLDRLQVMLSILDPVRMREALDPVEKVTAWGLF
jgi:hypothetical protein